MRRVTVTSSADAIGRYCEAAIEAGRLLVAKHGSGYAMFIDEGLDEPAMMVSAAMRAVVALAPHDKAAAKALFERHEKTLGEMFAHDKVAGFWTGHDASELLPILAAPVAVAAHALGHGGTSSKWYERARERIEPDQFWKKRFMVSWAALEIGRQGDLEELWGSDFWQESPNQSAPFVAYLVRSRRMSVLTDFVRRWAEEREDDEGPSNLVSSVAEQLLALGHVDDLRVFFPVAEEIAEGTLAYDDAVKAHHGRRFQCERNFV